VPAGGDDVGTAAAAPDDDDDDRVNNDKILFVWVSAVVRNMPLNDLPLNPLNVPAAAAVGDDTMADFGGIITAGRVCVSMACAGQYRMAPQSSFT
jgi:hypothetical protein